MVFYLDKYIVFFINLGKIKLKPFFDFDLNIDLKSLNFYILSKYINALDDENKNCIGTIIADAIKTAVSMSSLAIFALCTP